jgi:hypothetical protein
MMNQKKDFVSLKILYIQETIVSFLIQKNLLLKYV